MHPLRQTPFLSVETRHVCPGALHQEPTQILVPPFADSQQVRSTASAVLAWYQSHRCGEIASATVLLAIAELGAEQTGSDEAYSGDSHETLAEIVFAQLPAQFFLHVGDLFVKVFVMGVQAFEYGHKPCWQLVFCQHGRQSLDGARTDG